MESGWADHIELTRSTRLKAISAHAGENAR
jgi:hypothetical protein